MRTDSTRLANEAVDQVRGFIAQRFGEDYLPAKPRAYKSRSSAQDAHEAIRPTSALRTPQDMAKYLKRDELRLYQLIWNRFVACQMAPAVYNQTQALIKAGPGEFRASGQVMVFRGFTAVYVEDKDESGDKESDPAPGGRAAALGRKPDRGAGQAGTQAALHSAAPPLHRGQPGARA